VRVAEMIIIASDYICEDNEITLSSLIVTYRPCFYDDDENMSDLEDKYSSVTEIIECGDIHMNGLFEMEKHFCDDAKDIFSWIRRV
jgi:hypothetical protein